MNHIPVITTKTMQDIISTLIETHRDSGRQIFVPIFWGPPGVGKTSITKSVAERHGYRVVDLILSSIDEGDIAGIPVPLKNDGGDTNAFQRVPLKEIGDVLQDPKTILFLDEVSRCRTGVLQAIFQILSGAAGDLKICGRKIKGLVIAASNLGEDDGTVINTDIIDSSLQNKVTHFLIKPTRENFLSYLMSSESRIRKLLAIFLTEEGTPIYRPSENGEFGPWISPRSLTKMADSIEAILKLKGDITADIALINAVATGTAGDVGGQFVSWLAAGNINRETTVDEDTTHIQILYGNKKAKEHAINSSEEYKREIAEKLTAVLEKTTKIENEYGIIDAIDVIASCGKETLKASFGRIKANIVARRLINRLFKSGMLKSVESVINPEA